LARIPTEVGRCAIEQNLTIDNNIINGALDGHGNPVSDIGIAGLNSSNVTINGNQISNVQEAILGQEDANFSGGVFAPAWSIGNSNVVVNATQQGLDFEVGSTDTQSFNIVGTSNGNDLFIGGAGHDTFTSGGSGNDTFVYDVANNGTQASIGGSGTDTEIINGVATATTYNINPIGAGSELGIHIESGNGPANVVPATVANAQVTTQAIEEIDVNLGTAGDEVIISGDLGGTGVATHFGLAANVLSSSSIPTITNYSAAAGESIDLSALLDAKFGPGSDASKASNFVAVKEDAGGNSATLEINVNGTPGGTFVAAAHLGGVHSGDIVTAILDHAHTTAQLHAA
jgi:hypothetical protein